MNEEKQKSSSELLAEISKKQTWQLELMKTQNEELLAIKNKTHSILTYLVFFFWIWLASMVVGCYAYMAAHDPINRVRY